MADIFKGIRATQETLKAMGQPPLTDTERQAVRRRKPVVRVSNSPGSDPTAFSPNVPRVFATGTTPAEAQQTLRQILPTHIKESRRALRQTRGHFYY